MKEVILLAIFLLFTRTAQADLVAWWKMDEASWNGTTNEVVDSSGSGNHGTSYYGATTKVGIDNRAGFFDGVDDYVNCGYSASLGQLPTYTIEAWIYFLGGNDGQIASKTYKRSFRVSGSRRLYMQFHTPSGYYTSYTATGFIPLNTWTHVAVTYDDTGDRKARLYKDGVEVTYANQAAVVDALDNVSTVNLTIGVERTYDYFKGLIDDVKIYNTVLTTTEIAQHYYQGSKTRLR